MILIRFVTKERTAGVDSSESGETPTDDRRGESISNLVVRPLGYVENEPVIRRIGDRAFEYVLSVSTDCYPLTTHHHPLDDGPDNEWDQFERAVDTARTLYDRDGSLLMHCTAGISRSSTLVAATLAAEEKREFHDALSVVQRARPSAIPHPALHELAMVYLAARE
jgi:atypical dual specificity phosphatase